MATCIAVTVHMIWWYGKLPDVVPSHFDAEGNPDGEITKSAYYLLIGLVHAITAFGFPLLILGMKRMPVSLINIPNKDYWLAPERRDQTLQVSNAMLLLVGIFTMVLIACLFQLSAKVAIGTRDNINPEFFGCLVAYLILVFGVVGLMCFRFRLPMQKTD
jgi:uncharacterized membrane protein